MAGAEHADNPRFNDRSFAKPLADSEDELFEE